VNLKRYVINDGGLTSLQHTLDYGSLEALSSSRGLRQ